MASGSNSREKLEFNGELIEAGSRVDTVIKVGIDPLGRDLEIPCYIFHGKYDGPTLGITSAIHGDELNGVSILHFLIHGNDHIPNNEDDFIDVNKLKGTLILIPIANPESVLLMQRRATDGRDLNRQFPGNSSGNHSQRLAHALFSSIVPKSDFLIDIHTAPGTRVNLPHIRANFDNKDCKFLARAFGTNIVLHSLGSEGTMRREATNSGCPSILLETGSSNSFQIKNVEEGLDGILNVLKTLKMIEGEIQEPNYRVLVRKSRWIRAPSGGLLHCLINVGELVEKGQLIAHITDPFGNKTNDVFAPCKGLIVSIATIPLIRTGDPLVHLVLIKKTFNRIKKILEENEDCECEEELVNDEEGIPLDDMVFEMSEKTEPK
ncbi:MAG: succinylglutamate desuccinylase/aspartoacylase family protein [Candidatus Thermoplasmatota archaeon]|nr:succinylglutamate desuccinylase/aspartoacylase family protein [Candidatus Thermoplasmatota archaeon]